MSNKMLIDASHPEETRVVVLKGHRVEEFDFEAADRKQLRGNIYLAKVTRVEPSLQAAFVDYGGNRHGFLAFSEIHPDYYQIPHADRQALLEEEARAHREEEDEGRGGGHGGGGHGRDNTGHGGGQSGGGQGNGGNRRSRRHRRDGSERAAERRAPRDASVSEPALEAAASEAAATISLDDLAMADHGVVIDGVGTQGAGMEDAEMQGAGMEGAAERETVAESRVGATDEDEGATDEDAAVSGAAISMGETGTETLTVAADETPPVADTLVLDAGARDEAVEDEDTRDDAQERGTQHRGTHDQEAAPATLESDTAPSDLAAEAMLEGGGDGPTAEADGHDDDHGHDHHGDGDRHGDHHPGDSHDDHHDEDDNGHEEEEVVEQIGGDAFEESTHRAPRPRRHYKIQEVIKRRQILLVQVVKEERGNKGAALTTYLSLAGRYSVLMPNTARGGGISRKITDAEDRKRLKAIAQELDVPEGMGIILRTAGAARGKVEVMRDFEYLLRMWESVRELTLKSTAPTLVYEEGSLIKRAIRDLYTRDVEDVIVSGEEGHREARDFMRMLMPSAAKSVQLYRDPQPIFAKAGVEAQLDAMFSNHVTLRSGGYLVINQTEALVAIDVNSGRSTREHNIEDTALRTNMEAADEIARQLRLRDLAGLIVVDFIDMEEGRNNRAVERRIKEALKNDRARIQIGRISHFGLLEMSRQRIRTGVLEGSTVICPHCAGSGTVRSVASIALHVLRLLEDALIKDASHDLIVRTRTEVALYMLNQKRAKLTDLEIRFGVTLMVAVDPSLTGMIYHAIERGEPATPALPLPVRTNLVRVDSFAPVYDEAGGDFADEAAEAAEAAEATEDEDAGEEDEGGGEREASADAGENGRRRRRRRRRRGRDREVSADVVPEGPQPSDEALGTMARIEGDFMAPLPSDEAAGAVGDDEAEESFEPGEELGSEDLGNEDVGGPAPAEVVAAPVPAVEDEAAAEPPRRRRSRRNARAEDAVARAARTDAEDGASPAPKRRRRGSRAAVSVSEAGPDSAAETVAAEPAGAAVAAMAAPATEVPATEVAAIAAPAGEASATEVARPSAAPMFGIDGVEHHPPLDEPAPAMAADMPGEPNDLSPAGEAGAVQTVARDETAAGQDDAEAIDEPARPKRSGWWQRAKATFGS